MDESIVEWLDQQQANMLALLKDLVDIDSNSFDKAGVDRVGSRLVAFFDEHEIPHETIPLELHGDAIRAVVSGGTAINHSCFAAIATRCFQQAKCRNAPFQPPTAKPLDRAWQI